MQLKVGAFLLTHLLMAQPAAAQPVDQQAAAQFVTKFYEGYLNASPKRRDYLAKTPFFSHGAEALMKSNAKFCSELSRGDDICGFGADEDIYLDTQETGPNLNFTTSEFKAKASPSGVDVTFTVWPGEHQFYQKSIHFVLTADGDGPRVDDLFYNSAESSGRSMRAEIEAENAGVAKQAKDLDEAWNWIMNYIRESQADRFDRFVAFPVEICAAKCGVYKQGSQAVKDAFQNLNAAAAKARQAESAEESGPFSKDAPSDPKDGALVAKGAFVFKFMKSTWWLVKIDLAHLDGTF